ncbi:hypothetical protein OSTOST_12019 [Ostertagia ostertagi]
MCTAYTPQHIYGTEKSTSAEGRPRPTPASPAQPPAAPAAAQPPSTQAPTRAPKKDFIANVYHEDVVEQAIDQQKKPIRALAKEFAANKKIKPADYTTEAYEKNDAKNRYNDIICIDATRVVLKDRPPEDDYIHASWMTMPDGQKYICTQHEKCCFYLPREKKEVGNYGGFIVTVKSSKPDPFEGIKHTELEVKYG